MAVVILGAALTILRFGFELASLRVYQASVKPKKRLPTLEETLRLSDFHFAFNLILLAVIAVLQRVTEDGAGVPLYEALLGFFFTLTTISLFLALQTFLALRAFKTERITHIGEVTAPPVFRFYSAELAVALLALALLSYLLSLFSALASPLTFFIGGAGAVGLIWWNWVEMQRHNSLSP